MVLHCGATVGQRVIYRRLAARGEWTRMYALPRAEQPYTVKYPNLDIGKPLEVEFKESGDDEQSITRLAPPSAVRTAKTTPFNVPGYVGGKHLVPQFRELAHQSEVPDSISTIAGLGYTREIPQRTEHYKRPDATMEVYAPFGTTLAHDPLDLESKLESPNLCIEYDVDELDMAVLGVLTTRYRTPMLAEHFEVAMSMLDVCAAFLCLHMSPFKPSAVSTTQGRACAVCMYDECTDSNTIVFCDGCDVAVHQDCYGVHSIPEGRWLCRKCEAKKASGEQDIRCKLCPFRSGAFKRATTGEWVHLVCALWIPLVRVPEDTSFLEPIRDLEQMDPSRHTLRCYVCRDRRGACIQCAAPDCFTAFHPTCAQISGFYMTNYDHDITEMLRHQDFLPVYCHRHSQQHSPREIPLPVVDRARQELQAEKVRLAKSSSVSLFAGQGTHAGTYWRTKDTDTLILPHAVAVAVQVGLRSRIGLELDMTVVEFLCRYWTIKRDNRDGVMFSRRMYQALDVAERRVIRAEQSEESVNTPTELLRGIDALIYFLDDECEDDESDESDVSEDPIQDPIQKDREVNVSESSGHGYMRRALEPLVARFRGSPKKSPQQEAPPHSPPKPVSSPQKLFQKTPQKTPQKPLQKPLQNSPQKPPQNSPQKTPQKSLHISPQRKSRLSQSMLSTQQGCGSPSQWKRGSRKNIHWK